MKHCRRCHEDYPDDVADSGCCRRLHGWLPEVSITTEVLVTQDIREIQRHARIVRVR